jgi:hypothetical protein
MDRARGEPALGDQPLELGRRIGAASEARQDAPRDETVHGADVLTPDLPVDIAGRGLLAHVLDHRQPARAEHAVQLVQSAHRSPEVLEGRLADDQVEGAVGERNRGRVPVLECDGDARRGRVLAGDLHHRVADVQPGHLEASEPRHLDGEVPGAGRHLEHRGTVRQPGRQLRRLFAVQRDLARSAALAGVPPGRHALHLRQQVAPPIKSGAHAERPGSSIVVQRPSR